MRGLVLCLVVANGLYFLWQHVLAEKVGVVADSKSTSAALDVARLTLVNEESLAARSSCLFLGHFESAVKAGELVQRLVSLDIAALSEAHERTLGADYWVYLKPAAVKDAATRMLRDLRAFDLDAHMILEGELRHGISLGTFGQSAQAEQAMQKAERAGYQPYMQLLPRAQDEYWVRIAEASARLVDAGLINRLTKDFPGLVQQAKSCEGIATQKNIQ